MLARSGRWQEVVPAGEGGVPGQPHPDPKLPEVPNGPEHDLGLCAGRRTRGSRVVRDADLDHTPSRRPELDQEFGREEGALRFDADPVERVASEQLAGTIDIGDPEPEEDPVCEAISRA